jgi:hypothetical protein
MVLRPLGRAFGYLGRMKLMLEDVREILEDDPIFQIPRAR